MNQRLGTSVSRFIAPFLLVVSLGQFGCGPKADAEEKVVKPKGAFFRIANFTNGPVDVMVKGLPQSKPLEPFTATTFSKYRTGKLPVSIDGKEQQVDLAEPGATLYLVGSSGAPQQILIQGEQRSADKSAAYFRVVNLTPGSLTVEGVSETALKVAAQSAMDAVSQPLGICAPKISTGSAKLEDSFDLEAGKSYVIVVAKGANGQPKMVRFAAPEGMAVSTVQSAPQG